jgi:hypothetical protein
MQNNQSMAFSRRDTASGRCEEQSDEASHFQKQFSKKIEILTGTPFGTRARRGETAEPSGGSLLSYLIFNLINCAAALVGITFFYVSPLCEAL